MFIMLSMDAKIIPGRDIHKFPDRERNVRLQPNLTYYVSDKKVVPVGFSIRYYCFSPYYIWGQWVRLIELHDSESVKVILLKQESYHIDKERVRLLEEAGFEGVEDLINDPSILPHILFNKVFPRYNFHRLVRDYFPKRKTL